jgi:hypothetical protein
MYRCQHCQTIVPTHTKAHRIVVETRPRVYPARYVNMRWQHKSRKLVFDPAGEGHEIVREITVCPDCAAQHQPQKAGT